jgi:hypothetical protein
MVRRGAQSAIISSWRRPCRPRPFPEKSAATHCGWRRSEVVAANSTPQRVLPGVFDTLSQQPPEQFLLWNLDHFKPFSAMFLKFRPLEHGAERKNIIPKLFTIK